MSSTWRQGSGSSGILPFGGWPRAHSPPAHGSHCNDTDHTACAPVSSVPAGCCWPQAPAAGGERPPPYLGLAQEIHWFQMLQVPSVGPKDLTPGDLPRLQEDLLLEGFRPMQT